MWGPHSLHTAEASITLLQLRHMLHEGWGGQQRGSSSNLTRPRESPRVTRTTSVEWPAMQGFVGADLLGFLDGMQGVRGSNPLSSTRHNASSPSALSAICQRFARKRGP
jgi:hypothetical protein